MLPPQTCCNTPCRRPRPLTPEASLYPTHPPTPPAPPTPPPTLPPPPADLLQYTVSVALANHTLQPLLPAPLKAGLPHRWLADAALGAGGAATLAAAAGGFREWDAGAAAAAAAGKGSSKAAKPGGKAGGGGATAGLAKQLASACRRWVESTSDVGPCRGRAESVAKGHCEARGAAEDALQCSTCSLTAHPPTHVPTRPAAHAPLPQPGRVPGGRGGAGASAAADRGRHHG